VSGVCNGILVPLPFALQSASFMPILRWIDFMLYRWYERVNDWYERVNDGSGALGRASRCSVPSRGHIALGSSCTRWRAAYMPCGDNPTPDMLAEKQPGRFHLSLPIGLPLDLPDTAHGHYPAIGRFGRHQLPAPIPSQRRPHPRPDRARHRRCLRPCRRDQAE